jgi:ABC-type glycerol-3-phosphate transport system permease component
MEHGRKIGFTVLAWGIVLVLASPLAWMVLSSFKGPTEIIALPPTLWPQVFDPINYIHLFQGDFLIWFRNSLIVALSTTVLVNTVGTLGAYAITRLRFKGRSFAATVVLFTYMFPPVLMLVPLFIIFAALRVNDTYIALILADSTFGLPFAIWLLRSYLLSVPVQVEEAAMLDGAPRWVAFVEVVVPQIRPGIISVAIFSFILCWDDYLFASIFTSSSDMKTLPVGIARYANELNADWGVLMAASVATILPVLLVFAFLQSRLLPGLNAGAVKM